jgi:hypothetical protein
MGTGYGIGGYPAGIIIHIGSDYSGADNGQQQ